MREYVAVNLTNNVQTLTLDTVLKADSAVPVVSLRRVRWSRPVSGR
jgi:hypothetical protein